MECHTLGRGRVGGGTVSAYQCMKVFIKGRINDDTILGPRQAQRHVVDAVATAATVASLLLNRRYFAATINIAGPFWSASSFVDAKMEAITHAR